MLEEFEKKRKKICRFCEQNLGEVDYKDEKILKRFLSERGRILPRRITGNCAKHQRKVTQALKRARHLALLPFTAESYR